MTETKLPKKRMHIKRDGSHGEHPYGDLGQVTFLLGFLIIWILDSFVFHYSTFLSPYVPLYSRLIVAGLFLTFAFFLVRSGHRAVSNEVLSAPRLITGGGFSRVRHPLYLASLLFYLFLIAITLSLISLFIFIGVFIFYNSIAAYEEKFLEKKFGQDFRNYKKNVSRWIPRLR